MPAMRHGALILLAVGLLALTTRAQVPTDPDWTAAEAETLRHFQALVRFDTSDPPGNEKPAADYLKGVLEREGIPVELYALEPNRPNVVARLKGSGRKRPLLIVGHTDVVNVDAKKWTHPPFGAVRDGGYVYGRGTVDDKDNLSAALMVMLLLKRQNVPLDRDVIFLAESGEEGTTRVGIEHMVNQHFPAIDAEFCYAEGGGVERLNGRVRHASVQTMEKIPRGIDLIARGPAGHGSVPLTTNAVAHLASAVAKVAARRGPISSAWLHSPRPSSLNATEMCSA
jgi:acetylornithine deacetylase/succinyl-diaminopimelate desuccinylase-like protein